VLAAIGIGLMVVSSLLPWTYDVDFTGVVGDLRAVMAWHWGGLPNWVHPFVILAIAVLITLVVSTARPTLYWWLALVWATAVGALGLGLYWLSAQLYNASNTDVVSWTGPGVPMATLGFLAILTVAVQRLAELRGGMTGASRPAQGGLLRVVGWCGRVRSAGAPV
jgi:hypothetical protein